MRGGEPMVEQRANTASPSGVGQRSERAPAAERRVTRSVARSTRKAGWWPSSSAVKKIVEPDAGWAARSAASERPGNRLASGHIQVSSAPELLMSSKLPAP
jgi:hypothetical protein